MRGDILSAYKEIVTKAVVGKGKKYYKNTYTIDVGSPVDTVLGAWIINHKFTGKAIGKKIAINGSFDVNLWYSYDNDTKTAVITKSIPYDEVVTVSQKETADNSKDIIVRSLKDPSCVSAREDGSNIIKYAVCNHHIRTIVLCNTNDDKDCCRQQFEYRKDQINDRHCRIMCSYTHLNDI